MAEMGRRAKQASRQLAGASTAQKDAVLVRGAELLADRSDQVLAANRLDVEAAVAAQASDTVLDRLRLTDGKIRQMADGLRSVAELADPVGEVLDGWTRPNGLRIRRVRVPL